MPEPIKIIVQAEGTQQAGAQLDALASQAVAGLEKTAAAASHATSALGANRASVMELGHSVRAIADGLAAGMNPLRLMLMEAPRFGQAMAEASADLRTKVMGILPALGMVGAAVGAGVLVWKAMGAEWENAVKRNNELTEAFTKQADAIKVINAAAKGGAISADTRTDLLRRLGLNMPGGQISMRSDANTVPGLNAITSSHGLGDASMSAIGLPDRESVARVNEELAKMGVLLRTIDPKTREISYTVNPEMTQLEELTTAREKYEAQMELDFDKQRARAEKQHAEDLRNLDQELATAEQFRTMLQAKMQGERDPNVKSAMATVMGNFDPAKLNDARVVLEEQYQAKLADISQKEQEKRDRTAQEEERKQAEWQTQMREQNRKVEERQDKSLNDAIEANREQTKDHTVRLYQQEYEARIGLANQQLAQCVIDEDQYTDKIVSASKLRAQGEKAYNAELQRTADLKRAVDRGQFEGELQAIKADPFLSSDAADERTGNALRGLMGVNQAELGSLGNVVNSSTDEAARLEAQGRMVSLMQEQVQLKAQLDALAGQDSWSYQFLAVLTRLQNQGGTIQQEVAGIFGSTVESGINGVSHALTGLIEGTLTWKKALVEITQSTLGTLIQGFVKMGVQWVTQHILMAAATKMLATVTQSSQAQAELSTVSSATTQLAAHAAVAAGGAASAEASIPYVGPALAVAAMGTMLATVLGLASGFYDGGHTGYGSRTGIAGVVHNEEFVINAAAVDRIGVGPLEALNRGDISPGMAAGGAFSGTGGIGSAGVLPPKVVTVFDRQSLQEELKRPDYAHITVQHVMNNKQKIGIRT